MRPAMVGMFRRRWSTTSIACRWPLGPTPQGDHTTRRAEHRGTVVVRALLVVAEKSGTHEQAAFSIGIERRDLSDEAARIAADHGFGPDRLIAMRGLARTRGVELEVVLRAALRGDLYETVRLPPRPCKSERSR